MFTTNNNVKSQTESMRDLNLVVVRYMTVQVIKFPFIAEVIKTWHNGLQSLN